MVSAYGEFMRNIDARAGGESIQNVQADDGLVCIPLDTTMSGADIQALRKMYGLSVEDFAKKFGVTVETIERFERENAPA